MPHGNRSRKDTNGAELEGSIHVHIYRSIDMHGSQDNTMESSHDWQQKR
jgi:hypothetical protein